MATPPAIRELLRRSLERDPKHRLHDIADARIVLEDLLAGRALDPRASGVAAPSPLSRRGAAWPPWLLGIALGAVTLAILDRTLLAPAPQATAETARLEVLPPAGTLSSGPFDLARDGRSIVFVATRPDGQRALYVRALDSLEARRLPGTEGAEHPFFSPDARSVGFFADKKLQRIDLAGGSPRELAAVSDPRGASWGSAGVIVFAPDGGGPLFRIPESGGEAVAVTRLDKAQDETSHRWPQFLPDGSHFVFMSRKPSKPRLAARGRLPRRQRAPPARRGPLERPLRRRAVVLPAPDDALRAALRDGPERAPGRAAAGRRRRLAGPRHRRSRRLRRRERRPPGVPPRGHRGRSTHLARPRRQDAADGRGAGPHLESDALARRASGAGDRHRPRRHHVQRAAGRRCQLDRDEPDPA